MPNEIDLIIYRRATRGGGWGGGDPSPALKSLKKYVPT